jgi:hypothetical protein
MPTAPISGAPPDPPHTAGLGLMRFRRDAQDSRLARSSASGGRAAARFALAVEIHTKLADVIRKTLALAPERFA